MTTFSTTQTYALTNAFAGSAKQLSSNGAGNTPIMDTASSNDAEQWYLGAAPYQEYYYLHTGALGDAQVLDVINDNGTNSVNVHFTNTGFYSGQYWRFDPWSDGTYRLSNNFTGTGVYLDTYSGTLVPFLDGGEHSGQHWTFNV